MRIIKAMKVIPLQKLNHHNLTNLKKKKSNNSQTMLNMSKKRNLEL